MSRGSLSASLLFLSKTCDLLTNSTLLPSRKIFYYEGIILERKDAQYFPFSAKKFALYIFTENYIYIGENGLYQ
jgi:hypothetical protein